MTKDIDEITNRIMQFAVKRAEKKNYTLDPEVSLIHIMEELGELAKQFFNKKARPEKYDSENVKEEIADIILECMVLSKILNMDLSKELNKKMEELNNRNL